MPARVQWTVAVAPVWRLVTRLPALAALGALLTGVLVPFILNVQIPLVNVRWRTGVPEVERQYVAKHLSLRLRETREGDLWVCTLSNTSRENIAAIVASPAISDTYGLNRDTLTPSGDRSIPVSKWLVWQYPFLGNHYGKQLQRLVRVAALWPIFVALLLGGLVATRRGRQALVARIPLLSPAALGMFRVCLSAGLLVVVFKTIPGELRSASALVHTFPWLGRIDWVAHLAMDPIRWPRLVAIGGLLLFGLGIRARLGFVAFVACVTLASAASGKVSDHDFALPVRTLWLLCLVPWGDGFGLGEARRRFTGQGASVGPSRTYGFAVWIPTLMLGSAFLAAAFAKLDESGFAWISVGAIKYFLVEDALDAPVTWGRFIASHDTLAIVMSFGAIVLETAVILSALWATTRVRLLSGMACLALLSGFYVLQGIWWHGWWVLLLAFLPWETLAAALRDRLPPITVFIDGGCPLCRRSARRLWGLDWLDRLAFVDANEDASRNALWPGVTREAALQQMYIAEPDRHRISAGYDAYARLARVLPLTWGLAPFLAHPPASTLGRWLYEIIAARRRRGHRADGVCSLPDVARSLEASGHVSRQYGLPAAVVAILCLVVIQQPIASLFRVEYGPLLSDFPMYTGVHYDSKEAFASYQEEEHQPAPTIRLQPADGSDQALLVQRLGDVDVDGVVAAAGRLMSSGAELDERMKQRLTRVASAYRSRFGASPPPVRILSAPWRFDWSIAGFAQSPTWTSHGTLDASSGATTP